MIKGIDFKNKKIYFLILSFFMLVILLLNTNSNAAVNATRNVYSNNGSMKFNFTGLNLDVTHEYEFGLTKTTASEVQDWYLITEYTNNTAVVDLKMSTTNIRDIMNEVDTAYITIKNKTEDTIVLSKYSVNLKMPYLRVASFSLLNEGKEFGNGQTEGISIGMRNYHNSSPYYQYVKITNQNIIDEYKEIKENKGSIFELESMLTSTVPTTNWKSWRYWNYGDHSTGMNGVGFPESPIETPDYGLYYLWIYFSGEDIKDVYGYIIVDNLEPDISISSISLPSTKTLELGKTLELIPQFNPSNATNKIVTWSSSDENVATVNNAGKVTPKKVGSTIITVTTQDGNKKATCTVTVTKQSSSTITKTETTSTTNTNTKETSDKTTSKTKLPKTGLGYSIVLILIISLIGLISGIKYNKIKDIK